MTSQIKVTSFNEVYTVNDERERGPASSVHVRALSIRPTWPLILYFCGPLISTGCRISASKTIVRYKRIYINSSSCSFSQVIFFKKRKGL